jgi:hypothetical protein
MEFWYSYYSKLKSILGDQYGKGYWMDLCYFTEKVIEFYEDEVIRYILKEGKYVDEGGAPSFYDKSLIIELWEQKKDTGNRMSVYTEIANEIGVQPHLSDRTKRIQQIIKEHERGK